MTSILLGVFIPLIFIGLLAFGIFYSKKSKKFNHLKKQTKKADFIDDKTESNELQSYGSNEKTNNNKLE